MTTPLKCYQGHLEDGSIQPDFFQAKVAQHLQAVYDQLIAQKKSWLPSLKKKKPVQGVYIWGDVGAGKTYLMDLFFACLPFKDKKRIHFHHFMRDIQEKLKHCQGHKNPLRRIAKEIARRTCIICFDEFHVNDIADAMILARLFEALFAEGVTLVATSNIPPERLYWKGLQRSHFLPVIKLIQRLTTVIYLNNHMDYRLRHLHDAGVYYYPLGDAASKKMQHSFECLTHVSRSAHDTTFRLEGRDVVIHGRAHDVIWFDFHDICSVPRCQRDYMAIAAKFKTVLISDIPVLKADQRDLVCNFIHLVDVFYDGNIQLILSSAVPACELYPTGPLAFEFKRTQSRLTEMHSKEYLQRCVRSPE